MDLVIKELKQLIPLKVFLGSKARKAAPGKSKQLLAAGAFPLQGAFSLSASLSPYFTLCSLSRRDEAGRRGRGEKQTEREGERGRERE